MCSTLPFFMNRTSLCIRMLQILKARSSKRRPMNANELANELETNPRNIREYKKELIVAGYNIQEIKGRYGGYYLDEQCLFPNIRLSKEEELALREGFAFLKNTNFDKKDEFGKAIDKALNTSKDIHTVFPIFIDELNMQLSQNEREMIQCAKEAIEQRRCLDLSYQSKNKVKVENYLVDPYELIYYHNQYYMVGFNHTRRDYRMYRFSSERMKKCDLTQQSFLRDNTFRIEHYIGKNSLIKASYTRISVSVNDCVLRPFREVNWGIDFREDQENTYSFLVEDLYTFYRQIFSFGKDVTILSPQNIVEEYQNQLLSTLRNYGI